METDQHVLSGWKEVANYLHVGVRTAQRWESDLGLPVRRPRGRKRSAVLADGHELDLWLRSRPLGTPADLRHALVVGANAEMNRPATTSAELRRTVAQSRRELALARAALTENIRRLRAQISPPPAF